jgi:hypothetical protein
VVGDVAAGLVGWLQAVVHSDLNQHDNTLILSG